MNEEQNIEKVDQKKRLQLEKVNQNKEYFITLIKIRSNFLFPYLFQHFRIYLLVFALKLFIHGHG